MNVVWTDHAKEGRKQIANYIRTHFGFKYKKEFVKEVDKIVRTLMQQPNIGIVEPLLSDLPKTYRSIVVSHLSKIVYRIDDEIIYIVAIWDTRREPTSQARQIDN